MTEDDHRATRVRWRLVTPLLAVGLVLADGGGSSSSSTTTGAHASAPTSSGGSSTELQTFGGTIKAAENATFQAVYTSTSSSGGTQTITLEQSPPKRAFTTTDSSGSVSTLLTTGSATYACTTDPGGTPTCTSMSSSTGAGARSSLIGIYNGSTALAAIEGWQTVVAAHVSGVPLTFTDTTIAGQPVRCANWRYQGSSATYCVTDTGAPTEVVTTDGSASASGSGFELTSFTTAPPASDFAVPAGATVVTIPTGA